MSSTLQNFGWRIRVVSPGDSAAAVFCRARSWLLMAAAATLSSCRTAQLLHWAAALNTNSRVSLREIRKSEDWRTVKSQNSWTANLQNCRTQLLPIVNFCGICLYLEPNIEIFLNKYQPYIWNKVFAPREKNALKLINAPARLFQSLE